jgi:hypothetical protein
MSKIVKCKDDSSLVQIILCISRIKHKQNNYDSLTASYTSLAPLRDSAQEK